MIYDENMIDSMEIVHWRYQTDVVEAPPVTQGVDLEFLSREVSHCTACTLSGSRTQTVFGAGNPQADVLFVGEAPGMNEDKQGLPFVGRAGQLLSTMLQAIGLSRESVFICNVLKCRPPQNRDPSEQEVAACTPHLVKQIEAIQPRVIVALGRHAAHYLLKTDTPLGRLRNQWHQYQACDLLVTYHPAYLLRNPTDKRKAWEDLCALRDRIKQGSHLSN